MTNDPQATAKDYARIETCPTQRAWSVLRGLELDAEELTRRAVERITQAVRFHRARPTARTSAPRNPRHPI